MNQINKAIDTISYITELNNRKHWMNKLHPLFKLILTISYIIFVISIDKYDFLRIIPYIFYPLIMYTILDISIADTFKRMYLAIMLVVFIGILNPIFDKNIIYLAGYSINAGIISFITLAVKGILTVLSAYILIATTAIDDISYALKCLHLPNIIIMTINLIFRYLSVLLLEYDELTNAYTLRSYKNGIQFKDWGSFIGLLFLRTLDRSKTVYESMSLRGFNIDNINIYKKYENSYKYVIFILLWLIYFIIARYTYIILLIGGLFG